MDAKELLEKYSQGQRNFRIENLSGINLAGASLKEIDLRGANLQGANLSKVELARANLQSADLRKANLTEAVIIGANLSKSLINGAILTRVKGWSETKFVGSDLRSSDFTEADLTYVNFSQAILDNANLNKVNLTSANLNGSSLIGVNLSGANLSNIKWQDANLKAAKFLGVNLNRLNLSSLNLAGADFSGSDLNNTNFKNACLQRSILNVANLQGADLRNVNLRSANLKGADLTDARTYGWVIDGADFTGAIMPDGEVYQLELTREVDSQELSLGRLELMTRKIIKTEQAPAPVGPYNQAIAASGQLLFVSGQIAIDPRSNTIVYTDDVAKQTEQVMANLKAVLAEAGASFETVVKTTIFLKDMNDFSTVNQVYSGYFNPENAPARACVEVSRLPKDVLVEIDCIAVV